MGKIVQRLAKTTTNPKFTKSGNSSAPSYKNSALS